MACVVHGIYWPLIVKVRCFIMFLLDLDLNSKILVSLVFEYILFALNRVMRSCKSWLMCLSFLKSYLQVVN